MSQEFLARILEQKAREVEQMKLEEIQPLRQTYRLADYLKQHQDRLQVIAEVKRLALVWEISISMWILCNRPRLMKRTAQ